MLTQEEQEQLLQTVEMFDVIVQANPHDTQSLEILKDAYSRLGRKQDFLNVSRRMALTYMELGQFATAILEYERILQEEPDNPEIIAAMGDCEERMNSSFTVPPTTVPQAQGLGSATEGGNLITTAATRLGGPQRKPGASGAHGGASQAASNSLVDANEVLAKFLIQHRLAPEDMVQASLEKVQKVNASLSSSTIGASLIHEVVDRGAELETILCGILDNTRISYVPLEYYDVDRHVVKMLPEDLTLSRVMVPFDVVSRTVMVATSNPFDAAAKEAAQSRLDYHIQWHVASPAAIMHALSQVYRGVGHGGPAAAAPLHAPPPHQEPPPPAEPLEAPVFGEIPTPLPIPELKVSTSSDPLTAPDFGQEAPLPDTTDLRLKN
jgi:hypothetical protein